MVFPTRRDEHPNLTNCRHGVSALLPQKRLSWAAKVLLVTEVIVCFGPALLVLSLAAFLVPVQFVALNSDAMSAEGPLLVLTSVVAGAIGVGTLLYVLTKLLRGESVARPLPVLVRWLSRWRSPATRWGRSSATLE